MRPNETFPLQEALAVARSLPIFTTSLAPVPKSTAGKTSPTITKPNKGKGKPLHLFPVWFLTLSALSQL